jgi:mRNA interferase RelE/StbE
MRYQDTKEFRKSLIRLPHSVQIQVIHAIENIEIAATFSEILHFKALKGYRNYYRIRISTYRIGLYWDGEKFLIESIGTRGDFYKTYPPK